ncbi:MAG: helix-turn-helix transcriptional regulator [bacterium]
MGNDKLSDLSQTELPKQIHDNLRHFSVNGQPILQEPLWQERIKEIIEYLPDKVVEGAISRLQQVQGTYLPDIENFSTAFKLTRAETKLLLSLADGKNVREHAQTHKISANTGRVHMQHILEKTGTNSQIELLQLLHSFK